MPQEGNITGIFKGWEKSLGISPSTTFETQMLDIPFHLRCCRS